ncbi:hypothetical protein SUGI_0260990 [Cryptomeria japonica]|nr:hypothetical protein SUGI_0260990 [Cryptomeria japonica]
MEVGDSHELPTKTSRALKSLNPSRHLPSNIPVAAPEELEIVGPRSHATQVARLNARSYAALSALAAAAALAMIKERNVGVIYLCTSVSNFPASKMIKLIAVGA